MFQSYLTIAFRQLLRHKQFSALNIFGLAISMSVCMLVIMAVRDQYGYDAFHTNGDRIYRVISAEAEKNSPFPIGEPRHLSAFDAGNAAKRCPIYRSGNTRGEVGKRFSRGAKRPSPTNWGGYAVDQGFLEMFNFGWTEGNHSDALASRGRLF